jgi:hypothetical protein
MLDCHLNSQGPFADSEEYVDVREETAVDYDGQADRVNNLHKNWSELVDTQFEDFVGAIGLLNQTTRDPRFPTSGVELTRFILQRGWSCSRLGCAGMCVPHDGSSYIAGNSTPQVVLVVDTDSNIELLLPVSSCASPRCLGEEVTVVNREVQDALSFYAFYLDQYAAALEDLDSRIVPDLDILSIPFSREFLFHMGVRGRLSHLHHYFSIQHASIERLAQGSPLHSVHVSLDDVHYSDEAHPSAEAILGAMLSEIHVDD